jgi:hypothetical protein
MSISRWGFFGGMWTISPGYKAGWWPCDVEALEAVEDRSHDHRENGSDHPLRPLSSLDSEAFLSPGWSFRHMSRATPYRRLQALLAAGYRAGDQLLVRRQREGGGNAIVGQPC